MRGVLGSGQRSMNGLFWAKSQSLLEMCLYSELFWPVLSSNAGKCGPE